MCKTVRQFRAAVSGGLRPVEEFTENRALPAGHGFLEMRKAVERTDGTSLVGEW
jgi:hypothetical protein